MRWPGGHERVYHPDHLQAVLLERGAKSVSCRLVLGIRLPLRHPAGRDDEGSSLNACTKPFKSQARKGGRHERISKPVYPSAFSRENTASRPASVSKPSTPQRLRKSWRGGLLVAFVESRLTFRVLRILRTMPLAALEAFIVSVARRQAGCRSGGGYTGCRPRMRVSGMGR